MLNMDYIREILKFDLCFDLFFIAEVVHGSGLKSMFRLFVCCFMLSYHHF